VHLVEEMGQALDLVDDDGRSWRQCPQLVSELGNAREVPLVTGLVEEVDPVGSGELVADPRRLPRAAWAEEKERLRRRPEQAGTYSDAISPSFYADK
jgi:hypothetical protein